MPVEKYKLLRSQYYDIFSRHTYAKASQKSLEYISKLSDDLLNKLVSVYKRALKNVAGFDDNFSEALLHEKYHRGNRTYRTALCKRVECRYVKKVSD